MKQCFGQTARNAVWLCDPSSLDDPPTMLSSINHKTNQTEFSNASVLLLPLNGPFQNLV